MSTNIQIAVRSIYQSDDKRKYKQLLRELINDESIVHLKNHVIFINLIIAAVSG